MAQKKKEKEAQKVLYEDMILKLYIKLISMSIQRLGKIESVPNFTIDFCLISRPQTETLPNFQIPTQTLQPVVVSRQNRNFH